MFRTESEEGILNNLNISDLLEMPALQIPPLIHRASMQTDEEQWLSIAPNSINFAMPNTSTFSDKLCEVVYIQNQMWIKLENQCYRVTSLDQISPQPSQNVTTTQFTASVEDVADEQIAEQTNARRKRERPAAFYSEPASKKLKKNIENIAIRSETTQAETQKNDDAHEVIESGASSEINYGIEVGSEIATPEAQKNNNAVEEIASGASSEINYGNISIPSDIESKDNKEGVEEASENVIGDDHKSDQSSVKASSLISTRRNSDLFTTGMVQEVLLKNAKQLEDKKPARVKLIVKLANRDREFLLQPDDEVSDRDDNPTSNFYYPLDSQDNTNFKCLLYSIMKELDFVDFVSKSFLAKHGDTVATLSDKASGKIAHQWNVRDLIKCIVYLKKQHSDFIQKPEMRNLYNYLLARTEVFVRENNKYIKGSKKKQHISFTLDQYSNELIEQFENNYFEHNKLNLGTSTASTREVSYSISNTPTAYKK